MTKPSKFPRFSYLDAQPRQRQPAQLPLFVTTYRRYRRWTDRLQWNGSGQSGKRDGIRWRYGRHPYLKNAMYLCRASRDTPPTTHFPIVPRAFTDSSCYHKRPFVSRIR